MEADKKHYRFVNNQTGYAIAYFSIPITSTETEIGELLEKRRKDLATEHGIYYETISWEIDKAK
jgi:hypothetical protein